MRITKQQQELIDLMATYSDESSFYWSVSELMEQTGRSQQSLSRSLKTFEEKGLIKKVKVTGELIKYTVWYWEYILVSKLDEQAGLDVEKANDLAIEEQEAIELGYESVEKYRFAKLFRFAG